MINATAYAKINLGLRVGSLRDDGFHSLSGIFQSIDLRDRLMIEPHEVDTILTSTGGEAPEGLDNLAFRAIAAVRNAARSSQPIRLTLDKAIPVAAGLGGGSADAAAALALAGRFFGVGWDVVETLAPTLGSDVPFCLYGGTARVAGRGEDIERLPALTGFALGVVVPPYEVSTPRVFKRWDELGEPAGLRIAANHLPPALRHEESLINDLYPAAVSLVPDIDNWRQELETAWGRPVMMSGSGATLFGFFLDVGEAEDALASIPRGARMAQASGLSTNGWSITDEDPT